jgi:threonine/homoserine/homoserine lactone efflux protein
MLVFLGVAALLIVMPGQDTALTIRNTIAGGRAAGVATALGVGAAQAVWTSATALGVGALLVASQPAFLALRLAGAAYLGWLGLQALWHACRRSRLPAHGRAPRRPSVAFRQGVLSNLGNPKMLVFFTSLLPQFSRSGAGLLAHGLVFCGMTIAWLSLYAVALARIRRVLERSAVRRTLDAVTGVVLVGFGLRLASERP